MMAVDSHRNILAEGRTFLGWCVKRRWFRSNPLEGVKGRRSSGRLWQCYREAGEVPLWEMIRPNNFPKGFGARKWRILVELNGIEPSAS